MYGQINDCICHYKGSQYIGCLKLRCSIPLRIGRFIDTVNDREFINNGHDEIAQCKSNGECEKMRGRGHIFTLGGGCLVYTVYWDIRGNRFRGFPGGVTINIDFVGGFFFD